MARITLNIEFDTVEELREFMQTNPVTVEQYEEDESDEAQPVEQGKPKRKRRTKAEMMAAHQSEIQGEPRPVVKEAEEKVVIVPESAIEVMPQAIPVAPPVQPTAPLNLNGIGMPNFGPTVTNIAMQPVVSVTAQAPAQSPTPGPLPTDLLNALGGSM